MSNTAIVPVQKSSSSVVPKPSRSQLIDVMVLELIVLREAENQKRAAIRAKLKARLEREAEKFRKKKIPLEALNINWANAGACVYVQGTSLEGSPAMKELAHQLRQIPLLVVEPSLVRDEIDRKLKEDFTKTLMNHPGVKEGVRSAIARLGL